MRKKKTLAFLSCTLFIGCASTTYLNEYGENRLKNNDEYEKIDPNIRWKATFENGCPVINFYENFPNYDEIVDVSITEQINKKSFAIITISKESVCSYSGTGVVYKKSSNAQNLVSETSNIPEQVQPTEEPPQETAESEPIESSSSSFDEPTASPIAEATSDLPAQDAATENSEQNTATEISEQPQEITPSSSAAQQTTQTSPEEREKMREASKRYQKAMMNKKKASKQDREDLSAHGNDSNAKRN